MISKAFNPKTRQFTANFPKWSAAYADPNSNANKLLNPFTNTMEYMENALEDIHQDGVIGRVDIDRHPFKRWLIDYRDISGYDEEVYLTANAYLNNVSVVIGDINGTSISIEPIDNELDFFYPQMETGWYVAASFEHDISGEINACEVFDDRFYINVFEDGEVSDPGLLYAVTLPDRWIPTLEKAEELSVASGVPDPTYATFTINTITTEFNTRILLDHQISDRLDKVSVVDVLASNEADETVYASGVTITDTSAYKVGDTFVADLDNDGIIDQVELDLVSGQMGKSRSDFTEAEWEKYKAYDINGNELIDEEDLNIVIAMKDTVQKNVTAITLPEPGQYDIEYSIPDNGYAATRSLYGGPDGLAYFQNETYGYLESQWPEGYVDVSYDEDKDIYYYADDHAKAVWVYEENLTGGTLDRMKIQLPILTSMVVKGIHYHSYRIYVLVISAGAPYIITIRTDRDDVAGNTFVIPIHSGATPTGDVHIRLRDNTGISENAVGLCMINGAKLATVDEGAIKILLPIYDIFANSTATNGDIRISFREKYESLTPTPTGTISPVYQTLWNMIDTHGEEKGLRRLPGENNESFKKRIMDVYEHFPSRDNQGSRYGMQRELGLDIVDSYDAPEIKLLPAPIDRLNASTAKIYDDGTAVSYDDITVENQYRYGKYTHDKITYKQGDTAILTVDKDIVE